MEASEFSIISDNFQKSEEFKKKLMAFMSENGYDSFKVPQIAGRELDLYKLYTSVIRRGGYERVSTLKLWREIVNEFKLPESCTSASFTLRTHYQKYLFAYEHKYFFGNTNDGLTNFTANKFQSGLSQILPVTSEMQGSGYGLSTIPVMQIGGPLNSMAASLNTKVKSYTSKKIRLSQTEAESKRLVLAFESRIPTEITWALNTLCIFSCNISSPFTFSTFLLDSMCAYTKYALSKITSLDYSNIVDKIENAIPSDVPTLTESNKPLPTINLTYKPQVPQFSERLKGMLFSNSSFDSFRFKTRLYFCSLLCISNLKRFANIFFQNSKPSAPVKSVQL